MGHGGTTKKFSKAERHVHHEVTAHHIEFLSLVSTANRDNFSYFEDLRIVIQCVCFRLKSIWTVSTPSVCKCLRHGGAEGVGSGSVHSQGPARGMPQHPTLKNTAGLFLKARSVWGSNSHHLWLKQQSFPRLGWSRLLV